MERYIDADEIIRKILYFHSHTINGSGERYAYANAIRQINHTPTAEVEEVKHAKWEINCDGYYPYCSNCKTEPENGVMSKHCPECGAKMDGGKAE